MAGVKLSGSGGALLFLADDGTVFSLPLVMVRKLLSSGNSGWAVPLTRLPFKSVLSRVPVSPDYLVKKESYEAALAGGAGDLFSNKAQVVVKDVVGYSEDW